jgi:translation initiation factor IF-1
MSGIVETTLPLALYSVRLDDGRSVRASLSSTARHAITRLIPGDRVTVRITAHDPNRGLITSKTQ